MNVLAQARERVNAKTPPELLLVNEDAERAVLGRLLVDDRQWWDVADKLQANDFGLIKHSAVYNAMAALVSAGRTIAIAPLLAQMGANNRINDLNAGEFLYALFAAAREPEISRVPLQQFVDVVLHRAACRKLVVAAERIKEEAETAQLERTVEELHQSAMRLVSFSETEDADEEIKIGDAISKVISNAELSRTTGKRVGIRTGFKPFDDLTGPLLPGNMIVIAGETGSGKTALATQLSLGLAGQGIPGKMVSLEMGAMEIAIRVLATHCGLSSEKIVDGDLTPADFDRMMNGGEQFLDMPFWMDGRPRQSVATIQARLARAITRQGIKFGVVDHLQYVMGDSNKRDERERISQVVDDLKATAKRLQIVLFVLSHVSRQTDFGLIHTAADIRRPTLNNLYGSSAIEKAADATVFVHRPIWFLERATPPEKKKQDYTADLVQWSERAELVLPKRRNGKGFRVSQCFFDEERTWFSEERPSTLVHYQ